MNNTISVYELLGLIKDGKAPKRIRIFEDLIYDFDENNNFYYSNGSSLYRIFYDLGNALEEKVEILEEYKSMIEPITLNDWCEITYDKNWELLKNDFNKNMRTMFDRLDKIINYINKKEKELKEKPKIDKISINGKDIHKLEKLGIYEVIEDIESTLNEIIDKLEKEIENE